MPNRLPYAAEQLRTQVLQKKPRVKIERHGPADGFGVVRSLVFSKGATKWLSPILEVLADADPRIEDYEILADDRVVVTFTHTIKADDRTPFPLDRIDAVLRGA